MHLKGVRVVDLTRVISGPFCTMLLGDLGADVLKVEAPDGDPLRTQGSGREGLSWYYASFNRNKRSITLDLKTAEGKALLADLLSTADVLVENFRPGVLDRLGFDAARLEGIRPGLIVCAISGFGPDGPYRDRPAFDFIAQAMSGFMSVNGRPDDPPLRSGIPISDLVAGLYGALAVTAALYGRQKTVKGERIDVSLTSGMISLLAYIASHFFATGEVLQRSGNDHPIASPYGLFRSRDGAIAIAPSDDTFFGRLMDALELSHLKSDPDFKTNVLRVEHRARLNGLVQAKLAEQDAEHWISVLNEAGVPCGPVYGVDGVFADPQVASQKMAIDVEHPGHGTVRMLGFPIRMGSSPCSVRRPAPGLDEHRAEILDELEALRTALG